MHSRTETEFLHRLGHLLADFPEVRSRIFRDQFSNYIYIHLHFQSGKDRIKIADTPSKKVVTGCDGGGYLEVKVHE